MSQLAVSLNMSPTEDCRGASGDNFTDREKKTAHRLSNFQHRVNTVLISPRRWGKTSLVWKVCRLAQSDKLKVVYLDIFLLERAGFL